MKKHILVIVVCLSILTVGFSGCVDYSNSIDLNCDNTVITVQYHDKPLRISLTGSNNEITIDETVNITKITFGAGSQYNTVRVSHLHNFTVDYFGSNNNIEYYDQEQAQR